MHLLSDECQGILLLEVKIGAANGLIPSDNKPLHGVVLAQLSSMQMASPGGRLNKKDGLTRYGNSHVKDKTS